MVEPTGVAIVALSAGALFSVLLVRVFNKVVPVGLLPFDGIILQNQVLVFIVLVSLLLGISISAVSARYLAKLNCSLATQAANRAFTERSGARRGRQLIVISQTACAVVALILFVALFQAYRFVSTRPLGLDPAHVLLVSLALPQNAMSGLRWKTMGDSIVQQLRQEPRVALASIALSAPLTRTLRTSYSAGRGLAVQRADIADYRPVGPGYFSLLHIPVRIGREFLTTDTPGSPSVCIVNETAARVQRLEGGERGELGEEVQLLGMAGTKPCQIVGVARDVAPAEIQAAPSPTIYVPFDQMPDQVVQSFMTVMVRVSLTDPPRDHESYVVEKIRTIVRNIAPTLPVTVTSVSALASKRLAGDRFRTLVMGLVGILIISLSCYSVYGSTSHYIIHGKRALTIRLALGSTTFRLMTYVIRNAMALVISGLLVGLPVSYMVFRALGALFVGTATPSSFVMYAVTAAIIIGAISCCSAYVATRSLLTLDTAEVLKDM